MCLNRLCCWLDGIAVPLFVNRETAMLSNFSTTSIFCVMCIHHPTLPAFSCLLIVVKILHQQCWAWSKLCNSHFEDENFQKNSPWQRCLLIGHLQVHNMRCYKKIYSLVCQPQQFVCAKVFNASHVLSLDFMIRRHVYWYFVCTIDLSAPVALMQAMFWGQTRI